MFTNIKNFNIYSSLDPDYKPISPQYVLYGQMEASFHDYLNRSKDILNDAGFQATMNQTKMNVFVTALEPLEEIDSLILTLVVTVPISAGIIVVLVIIIKRRKRLNKKI
ncbi:unnamed protein product [marine sediment metagenome]|uniref:Uncharacterized protein n=1 Tax=marine sediment metagenome TaxID=412755 RepID=X1ED99_9ZZZZ